MKSLTGLSGLPVQPTTTATCATPASGATVGAAVSRSAGRASSTVSVARAPEGEAAGGQQANPCSRLQARPLAPRIARAAGSSCHVQRHLLGTRTARDARLFGPARRRPARFIGKRRAAKRHKIGRAVGCRRASAGHGSCAGHSRLKRPPMASLAAHMRCAKYGRNDTIPLRGFWCNIHTYLFWEQTADAFSRRFIARGSKR